MFIASIVDKDYIQYGFAGFAFVLLAVVVWLIVVVLRNSKDQNAALVSVVEKSNSISAKLIDAIKSLSFKEDHSKESMDLFRTETQNSLKEILDKGSTDTEKLGTKIDDLREMFLARPCMKKDK